MLHAAAHEFGWRTALFALTAGRWDDTLLADPAAQPSEAGAIHDDRQDETEPFHLDDMEIASRLVDDPPLLG